MLENINIEKILFLDIETVPMVSRYEELPERIRDLWDKKAEMLTRYGKQAAEEESAPIHLFSKAGIYAEFGKIVCISTGFLRAGSLQPEMFLDAC